MENQELFEQLEQLKRSLQEIDAARQMVDNTIQSFGGVSSSIESYSKQLSSVSDEISQLITQINQNRDTLSSAIDDRMDAALDKAEQTSDKFSQVTANVLASFMKDTQDHIRDLKSAATSITTKAQNVISQATEAAVELQSKSAIALENASSNLQTATERLLEQIEKQQMLFKKEMNKRIFVCTSILAALLLAILMLSLFH